MLEVLPWIHLWLSMWEAAFAVAWSLAWDLVKGTKLPQPQVFVIVLTEGEVHELCMTRSSMLEFH